jgi:hypothetical protein
MQFQDEELSLLYNALDNKLSALFSSRLTRKANGDWDEYDEEDYWTVFKKHQPLWDKLHQLVKEQK